MNRCDEDTVLSILETMPVLTTQGRIYVRQDGHLGLDMAHEYMGCVARTILNGVVGGYNRRAILSALSALFLQMKHLAARCVLKLDNPYIRGNMKTFQIRTLETAHYEKCLSRIVHGISGVRELLCALCIMYKTDTETCDQLQDYIRSCGLIHDQLIPLLSEQMPLITT
jgi:hypothetical protein